jgi:hypothetical protein
MGASVGRGFQNPRMSNSLFGGPSLQQPQATVAGRRTMPGGPLLPRLPRNPFAIKAQKIAKLSTPYQPKNLNDMF